MKPMRMSLVSLLLVFSVAPLAKSAAQAPSSQGTIVTDTSAADSGRGRGSRDQCGGKASHRC
jgi:hypothetical protein